MTNEKPKSRIEMPKVIFGVQVEGAIERMLAGKTEEQPETVSQQIGPNVEGFIPIPGLELYFAKQRTHLGEDWNKTHLSLSAEGLRMPTVDEFRKTLKYFKESQDRELQALYEEITQVREPWRANWLDADFKVVNGVLHINYNHRMQNGTLTPRNSEPLATDTLMTNKSPGISLENWLANATSQGLPKQDIAEGRLYYYAPMSDNNSVAGFSASSGRADLGCNGSPSDSYSDLGVFGVVGAGQITRQQGGKGK
jgi:hypothetical protein